MTNGNTYVHVETFAQATGLSAAEAYRLLADDRTRATIDALEAGRTASVEDLSRAVADREAVARSEASLETVRLSLVHVVLPKLDACGVLTYDRSGNRVVVDEFDRLADVTASPNQSA